MLVNTDNLTRDELVDLWDRSVSASQNLSRFVHFLSEDDKLVIDRARNALFGIREELYAKIEELYAKLEGKR